MFQTEFYAADTEPDSDPDPTLTIETDNLGDMCERIADHYDIHSVDITFIDNANGFDRYDVCDSFDLRRLGVAIVEVV